MALGVAYGQDIQCSIRHYRHNSVAILLPHVCGTNPIFIFNEYAILLVFGHG